MRIVDIRVAKIHLSRLVEVAAQGEEIVIVKAGRAVARLVPLDSPRRKRHLGLLAGKLRVTADFDAPLPDEILNAFEER